MRSPSDAEYLRRVEQVEGLLGPCVVISLTFTMLHKSTIDAVEPLRKLLVRAGLHDYSTQGQGAKAHGVVLRSRFVSQGQSGEAGTSFFRPKAGKGDPRFWVYGFRRRATVGDQIAVAVGSNGLLVVNLSGTDWPATLQLVEAYLAPHAIRPSIDHPALPELLNTLRGIARGPHLPGLLEADTSVGRTLELALGISMNSSKQPDYKGIELKFARDRPPSRRSRSNLFAEQADWSISPLKSADAILNEFGYWRDGQRKISHTSSALRRNSLGLRLSHNMVDNTIDELSDRPHLPVVDRWRVTRLQERLIEKHSATAWVAVDSRVIDGVEHFRPITVLYTSEPKPDVFPLMVGAGQITLEHLIRTKGPSGRGYDKGPLWKLNAAGHDVLFGKSKSIDLT